MEQGWNNENALDFYSLDSPRSRHRATFCFIALLSIKRPNVFTAAKCAVGLEWTCRVKGGKTSWWEG